MFTMLKLFFFQIDYLISLRKRIKKNFHMALNVTFKLIITETFLSVFVIGTNKINQVELLNEFFKAFSSNLF